MNPILILSVAVGHIISPLTFVIRAIGVNHEAHTTSVVICKDTNVVQTDIVKHHSIACSDFDIFFAEKNSLTFDFGLKLAVNVPVFGNFVFEFSESCLYLRILLEEKGLLCLLNVGCGTL